MIKDKRMKVTTLESQMKQVNDGAGYKGLEDVRKSGALADPTLMKKVTIADENSAEKESSLSPQKTTI